VTDCALPLCSIQVCINGGYQSSAVVHLYGGPKSRAMRQYLSGIIYAMIDELYVTIYNNYVTIEDKQATVSMRR